jgi:murein DD-endopeptidase MepM/ murein hydrolase activator NlpD
MYHLDRRKNVKGQAVIALLSVILFTIAGGGIGFLIGRYADLPGPALTHIDPAPISQAPLDSVQLAGQSNAPDLDALTSRLGDVQADLIRLNALGERLVQMSGLNPEEFDFQAPPPQGGPDEGSPAKDYTIREIASELGSVVSLLKDRKRKLEILEEAIMEKDLVAQSVPSGWPVRSGYITSNYGMRVHPTKHRRIFHEGVDFAAPRGTPIIAVADGVVVFSGKRGGYGRVVDIRHVNGLVTRYAHNQTNLVREGQQVRQGQKIATVGSSGTATGPHVHFEVLKNGEHQNPIRYAGKAPPRSAEFAAQIAHLDKSG